MHNEAQNLRTRIKSTESRFGALEELADKDDDLTENAKAKVGQAKTDSESVEKLTDDALKSIKEIIKELSNMKDISMKDLDELGEFVSYIASDVILNNRCFQTRNLTRQRLNSSVPSSTDESTRFEP